MSLVTNCLIRSISIQFIILIGFSQLATIKTYGQENNKKVYTIIYNTKSPQYEKIVQPRFISQSTKNDDYSKIDTRNDQVSSSITLQFDKIKMLSDSVALKKIEIKNNVRDLSELGAYGMFYLPNVPSFISASSYESSNVIVKNDLNRTLNILDLRTGKLAERVESAFYELENSITSNPIQMKVTSDKDLVDSFRVVRANMRILPWSFIENNILIFEDDITADLDSTNYLFVADMSLGHSKDVKINKLSFSKLFLEKLKNIELNYFKDFCIVDFFSSSFDCNTSKDTLLHGQKVYNVVESILKSTGLFKKVESRIKKVPINYFDHQAYFENEIKPFLKATVSAEDNSLIGELKALNSAFSSIKKDYKRSSTTIPKIYYTTVFNSICNSSTDVISTSLSLNSNSPSIPDTYSPNYNLVVSGFNSNVNLSIYWKGESEKMSTATKTFIYPQQAIVLKYPTQGGIIVGGVNSDFENIGTYGSDVTTHGYANGWSNDAGCINERDQGLSFATPQIATYIFIAKAFWRKYFKELSIGSLEVRKRLIASSIINPKIENLSQSSGIPNLELLCNMSIPFVLDSNNIIRAFDFKNNEKLVPALYERVILSKYPVSIPFENSLLKEKDFKDLGKYRICAIQFLNNEYYVCKYDGISDCKWEKIEDKTKIDMVVGTFLINGESLNFEDLIKRKVKFISFISKTK